MDREARPAAGILRICIADDHVIVRKGIRQILSETEDLVVSKEASTGVEVLRAAEGGECDVILLDISMPGRSGLEVLKDLRTLFPKIPVLILSIYPEEQYAVRALRTGAAGYLTKDSAPEELIAAIRKIAEGKKYVSLSLAEKLASYLESDAGRPLHEAMSNREFSVLCMIGSGKSVSQIAEELHLSVKTIATYRSRILAKLGVKGNAEIMRYALRNRLVE
jgi:DNA-binding NarL/FixJ family response regulator